MPDFSPVQRYPVPDENHHDLKTRIRNAIMREDARPDIPNRETGLAFALLAAAREWEDHDCECTRCREDFLEAVRLLVIS